MASLRRTWLYKADSATRNQPLSYQWTPNQEVMEILERNEVHWKKSRVSQTQQAFSFLTKNFSAHTFGLEQIRHWKTYLDRNKVDVKLLAKVFNELKTLGALKMKYEFWDYMNSEYLLIDHPLPPKLGEVVESKFQYWVDYGNMVESQYDLMLKEFQRWIRDLEALQRG